jgi:exonuclease III
MDMRFGMWNVRSIYRTGSLKTSELGKYKLDLVCVQEVRWEKGGTEWAEDYTFFCGERNGDYQSGTGFFIRKRIISAFRRMEFISYRVSYIILRGHSCNIIVLNVHAPCEDKSEDVKDSFCEALGHVLDQCRRYNMKILLGDFKNRQGRYFQLTIGYDCSHKISNDSGAIVVKSATSKNLAVKNTKFPHCNIHKYT